MISSCGRTGICFLKFGIIPRAYRLVHSYVPEISRRKVFEVILPMGFEVYYACSNTVWPSKGAEERHLVVSWFHMKEHGG